MTVRCEGCGAICHPDELAPCLLCGEQYCAKLSRDCLCSCSRKARAAYDAVHGEGAYERQAKLDMAGVTVEQFALAVLGHYITPKLDS